MTPPRDPFSADIPHRWDLHQPLVSICVPTYDRADLLRESLRTLCAQTYAPLEILISDNASTDQTESVCRELAGRDPRVRYVRHRTNMGIHANHNFCIDASRGELLCFFHDDDLYTPEITAEYVGFLQAHPAVGIVCSDWDLIDGEGRPIGARVFNVKSVMPGLEYIDRTIRSGRSCVGCSGAMLRRAALGDIRFNAAGPIGFEDLVVWFRIAETSDIGHVHRRLWQYRLHRRSLSRGTILRMARYFRETLFRYCDGYEGRRPEARSLVARWRANIDRYLFWALLYEVGLYFRRPGTKVSPANGERTVFELAEYRLTPAEFQDVLEALRLYKAGPFQHATFLLLRALLGARLTWPIGWAAQYSSAVRGLLGLR